MSRGVLYTLLHAACNSADLINLPLQKKTADPVPRPAAGEGRSHRPRRRRFLRSIRQQRGSGVPPSSAYTGVARLSRGKEPLCRPLCGGRTHPDGPGHSAWRPGCRPRLPPCRTEKFPVWRGVEERSRRSLPSLPGSQEIIHILISPASSVTRAALRAFSLVSSSDMAYSGDGGQRPPRKPMVPMASRPRSSWRRLRWRGARPRPRPPATCLFRRRRLLYIGAAVPQPTVTFFAPASKEFSTSSFITEAGRSTTSAGGDGVRQMG